MYYKNILSIKDYQINIQLPDSLYKESKIIYEDLATNRWDSLFHNSNYIVPLDSSEKVAYGKIDSSLYFVDAFTPTGFLAKGAIEEMREDARKAIDQMGKEKSTTKSGLRISPQLWYNRVDGYHFSINNSYMISERTKLNFSAGYKTVLKKLTFGIGLSYAWLKNKSGWLGLDYHRGSDTRYESELYSRTVASILPLFGQADYFDYYWNERVRSYINYRIKRINTYLWLGLNFEKHKSLSAGTNKSLIGSGFKQRINPAIDEGNLSSFELNIQYGPKFIPFGIAGQNRLLLNIEYSSPDFITSDFTFTRWQFIMDCRLNTFLRRRMLPNTLDIRLVAGSFSGELPLQKFGALDTGLGIFSSFGAFKTNKYHPYEGEKYIGFWAEHNFTTVPFELLGLNFIAKRGVELIIHGGVGRTWISANRLQILGYNPQYQDSYFSEIGFSVNKLFYVFRFDFSYRIDKPGYFFTISAPKDFTIIN